jgi:hypothetical protein
MDTIARLIDIVFLPFDELNRRYIFECYQKRPDLIKFMIEVCNVATPWVKRVVPARYELERIKIHQDFVGQQCCVCKQDFRRMDAVLYHEPVGSHPLHTRCSVPLILAGNVRCPVCKININKVCGYSVTDPEIPSMIQLLLAYADSIDKANMTVIHNKTKLQEYLAKGPITPYLRGVMLERVLETSNDDVTARILIEDGPIQEAYRLRAISHAESLHKKDLVKLLEALPRGPS